MLVSFYNDLVTLRKIVAEHHADIAAIFAEQWLTFLPLLLNRERIRLVRMQF
jgi:glutamate-1-semialdehyde aminotransferase